MRRLLVAALALLTLSGCQHVYFNTMENAGIDKREIFTHRVEDARGAENQARQQLRDTLDNYRRVLLLDSSDLAQRYDLFTASQARNPVNVRALRQRVANLQDIGEAMFADWQDDLKGYRDQGLRDASAAQLDNTRTSYQRVLQQLRDTESGLNASQALFNDPQLMLRHNLTPDGTNALKNGYPAIQSQVEQQLRQMQATVDSCDAFLRQLQATPKS